MIFNIEMEIIVDEDANFLTVDGAYKDCVEDLILAMFYDIDDVNVLDIEVKQE